MTNIGIQLVSFLSGNGDPYGGPIPSAIAKMNFLTETFEFNGESVSASTLLSGYDSTATDEYGTATREGNTNRPIASAALLAAIEEEMPTGVTFIVEIDNRGFDDIGMLFFTFSDADPNMANYSVQAFLPGPSQFINPAFELDDYEQDDRVKIDLIADADLDSTGILRFAMTMGRPGPDGYEYAVAINGTSLVQSAFTSSSDLLTLHEGNLPLLAFGAFEEWFYWWEHTYIRKIEIYPALNNATTELKSAEGVPLTLATDVTPEPDGTIGLTYIDFTLKGRGGQPPYTYSVASGSLPPGITLNSSTGLVSGTPTTAGTYSPVFRVTDYANQTLDLPHTITVRPFGQVLHNTGKTGTGPHETFTAIEYPLGSVDDSRVMVMCFALYTGADVTREITSVVIDGVTATLAGSTSSQFVKQYIYYAELPSANETGLFTINVSDVDETTNIQFITHILYGLEITAVEAQSGYPESFGLPAPPVNITFPDDSIVFAMSQQFHEYPFEWSGLTFRGRRYDGTTGSGRQTNTAADTFETGDTITVSTIDGGDMLVVALSGTVV